MGKIVESYRVPLEQEISRWNGFARALRKEDREASLQVALAMSPVIYHLLLFYHASWYFGIEM
jgi:hypothetical protein